MEFWIHVRIEGTYSIQAEKEEQAKEIFEKLIPEIRRAIGDGESTDVEIVDILPAAY